MSPPRAGTTFQVAVPSLPIARCPRCGTEPGAVAASCGRPLGDELCAGAVSLYPCNGLEHSPDALVPPLGVPLQNCEGRDADGVVERPRVRSVVEAAHVLDCPDVALELDLIANLQHCPSPLLV